MTDQLSPPLSDDKRARRPDKTYSKHIMLTEFGRKKIEAWASKNHLNFSASIETLALMGLDDERSSYAIPALRATTLQGIRLSFNRIARLLSDIAIESAASRTMSEAMMLQIIREMAEGHPDDFKDKMIISRNGHNPLHAHIRDHHEEIKTVVEQAAIRRLSKSVSRVQELFAGDEEEQMHD